MKRDGSSFKPQKSKDHKDCDVSKSTKKSLTVRLWPRGRFFGCHCIDERSASSESSSVVGERRRRQRKTVADAEKPAEKIVDEKKSPPSDKPETGMTWSSSVSAAVHSSRRRRAIVETGGIDDCVVATRQGVVADGDDVQVKGGDYWQAAVLSSTTAATPSAVGDSLDSSHPDRTIRYALSLPARQGELLMCSCLPSEGYHDGPRREQLRRDPSLEGGWSSAAVDTASDAGASSLSKDQSFVFGHLEGRRGSSASQFRLHGVAVKKKFVSRKSSSSLLSLVGFPCGLTFG